MNPTAAGARDTGLRLISKLNRCMIAGAVALAGVVSIVAENSFHGRTATAASSTQSSRSSSSSGSSSTSTAVLDSFAPIGLFDALRAAGLVGAVGFAFGLGVWVPHGPLGHDWAPRSGDPAAAALKASGSAPQRLS